MKNLMNKMQPYMLTPNIAANIWAIRDNIREPETIEVRRIACTIFSGIKNDLLKR